MSSEGQKKDEAALALFKEARPLALIRDALGFRSTVSVQAAINRALEVASRGKDAETLRRLEIERLDSVYRAVYPLALEGDLPSVDRVLKIGEARARLQADPEKSSGSIAEAFQRSVNALEHVEAEGKDEAIVAAGLAVAKQIDFTIAHGTGLEVTKALYLIPHLMNVLRELGATPEARKAVQASAPKKAELSSLDAFRAKALGGNTG
ncbi:terminase small subunit [Trueperella pyogenes]|uniref:terminase small subunit n=1 Tax=Trueperella pyogenes TaxID=1661 RepID=UPI00345D1C13